MSWELIAKSITPADAAPAYILYASASGCVALIPSHSSRILTAAPLVLAAIGFYRGASFFGANAEVNTVAARWVG